MSVLRRRGGTPAPVRWLLACQLVVSLGVCAMFPIVPLYVRQHGGSAVAVALFVAGPLLANALVQVPAGRLVDRVGRRPVLLGSLAGYAALQAVLGVDHGPLWLLGAVRAGTGIFGGAFTPAMRATIGDLTPPQQRAERFGMAQSAFMVGLLVGPAVGGAIAAVQQSLVFVCSAAGAAAGGVLVAVKVPETRGLAVAEAALHAGASALSHARAALGAWWRVRGVLVAMVGLGAMGLVMSMYDVVWPLYLSSRGQGTVVIGLSITLYSVPFLVLSRSGGRLADRSNRRALLAANFSVAALTATTYPFLHSLTLILVVGLVEAVSWVTTEPILYAVLTDATPADSRGRAMAAGGLAEYAGGGVGALALGSLYGVAEGIPFFASAVVLAGAGVLCAALVPARPRVQWEMLRAGEAAPVGSEVVAVAK